VKGSLALPAFLRFNYSMTASEKTTLARFINLASDKMRDGYRSEHSTSEQAFSPEQIKNNQNIINDDIQSGFEYTSMPSPDAMESEKENSLEEIAAEINACTGCSLCKTRTHTVPGEGARHPLVMVIGEGPGAEEDKTGRPFVGNAGQLLDKMLAAVGLSRETNCFIANVVKCRPPGNRDPLPEETTSCASFLERQILLLNPKIILCAGRIAAQTLLKTAETTGKLRGAITKLRVTDSVFPIIVTYHPSALLHNDSYKRPAWEDLKMLKAWLEEH